MAEGKGKIFRVNLGLSVYIISSSSLLDKTLTPNDAVDVLEKLLPAQNMSYMLGLKLKLPDHEVKSIHSTYSDPRDRLLHLLIKFTNQTEPRPTWRVIVKALRSPAVDLQALADKIDRDHCAKSTTSFMATGRSQQTPIR